MKKKIYEVPITSKKDGTLKIKKFPIDEGMYKAIKSLPSFEEQVEWFTKEYRLFKKEENYRKHHHADSLELEDPELGVAHQVQDDSLTPSEYCLERERDILLSDAISHLNPRQRMVIHEIFYEGKTQVEVANEMGKSESAMSHYVEYVLAKLRKELIGKI